jgi:hypothetical protein
MKSYPEYTQEKYAKFKFRGISDIFNAIYRIDLSPISRVLLENLAVGKPAKKFPAIHAT